MSGRIGVDTTAEDAVAVTPSATTTYNPPLRGLFVGTGGNVNVVTAAGNTVLIACANNAVIPVACQQVLAASTTASGITGLRS